VTTIRRVGLRAGLVMLVAAGVVACGLPSDETAHDLSPDDVPFNLLAPSTTTIRDTPPGDDTQIVNLYFQQDERLIAVGGEVEAPDDPTTFDPQVAVTKLLQGTSGLEVPPGARSAIPGGTRLLGAQISGDTVTLNFSEQLGTVESNGLVFAIAQIVYTAADITSENLDGVYRVAIQIDGDTITVPDDEGVELDRPVSPSDYPTLRPVTTRVGG
jgi:spore germination protein GerM